MRDVEEGAMFIIQPYPALFLGDILPYHDHAVLTVAGDAAIDPVGHVFAFQPPRRVDTRHHDGVLDVVGPTTGSRGDLVPWRADQGFPDPRRQRLGLGHQYGHVVIAENKLDILVVPAVEILGLRKVAVTAQQNLAKAGTLAR